MNPLIEDEFGHRARPLRLETLSQLRWVAAGGQIVTMLVVYFVLDVRFPLTLGLFFTATSCTLNLWLRWRFTPAYLLSDQFATALLAFDIVQLAALLSLSGGLANPFAIFFLAPIGTAAASLPWRNVLMLLILSLICETLLELWRLPLQLGPSTTFIPPPMISAGLGISYSLGAVFVALYGGRVAGEARRLASALNATELILARAQHLSQLDGLAAAAAHELGTPLATVQIVVHELAAQPEIAAIAADDLKLAEEQLARCRHILGKLSSPEVMADHLLDEGGLADLLEELVTPHRLQEVDIDVVAHGDGPEPQTGRNPAIVYGLTNLIENAVSFAADRVTIYASWATSEITIVIADDGPGFPPQVLARLGEPYISDRGAARRADGKPAGGLGLGLFIAKALLERSGARLAIANSDETGGGAIATVVWPRAAFEHARGWAGRAAAEPLETMAGVK